MRGFVFRTAAFGAFFLVAAQPVAWLYRALVLERTDLVQTQEQFDALPSPPALLILGDSHPKAAIETTLLPGSFNLASNGEAYSQTRLRFERLREQERLPSVVLLPLDDHSFAAFRAGRIINDWYWVNHIDYFEIARDHGPRFLAKWAAGHVVPFLDGGQFLRWRISVARGRRTPPRVEDGFRPLAGDFSRLPPAGRMAAANARAERMLRQRPWIDPTLARSFEILLRDAREAGVAVVLVRYPITSEYAASAPPGLRDELFAFARPMADRYSNIEGLLDYTTLYADRPDLFHDSDHLNARGAREFTKVLLDDLRALGVVANADVEATPGFIASDAGPRASPDARMTRSRSSRR